MKQVITVFTLVFTVMFSSTSYADWTKVGENVVKTVFYVDFDRIRKHGGYVYWWDLGDYLKPTSQGHLSSKTYNQGDCKLFRSRSLTGIFYKEPMGGGTSQSDNTPDKEWTYPHPNSSGEITLKKICEYEN